MKDMRHSFRQSVTSLLYVGVTFVPIKPPGSAANDSLVGKLFGNGGVDVGTMLNTAFQVAINVGAILAMMRIMWAGWLYMGSADMWSNKHHAKEVFQNAIIGLLVLLAIWIILHQINPCILDVGAFNGQGSGSGCGADIINSQTQAPQYNPQLPTFN